MIDRIRMLPSIGEHRLAQRGLVERDLDAVARHVGRHVDNPDQAVRRSRSWSPKASTIQCDPQALTDVIGLVDHEIVIVAQHELRGYRLGSRR